ncbi:MAG TPA: pyrimidine dimer DNA glycosylase/endonuclease V [Candidatus Nanoarchaeia archaeon]|nr:pyrimidine dimer DNA glycosylase/endonuclease V [Candidatus Nanoarchaeia archaeon]
MRIWDIPPDKFCRNHLLGEHRELHAIWSILTKGKKAYSNHPETLRWKGKLKSLYLRHEMLVQEMKNRGYNHYTPLPAELATGNEIQDQFVNSYDEQIKILQNKGCGCKV